MKQGIRQSWAHTESSQWRGKLGLRGRHAEHEGRGFDCQLYLPARCSTPGRTPEEGPVQGPTPPTAKKGAGIVRTGGPRPGKRAGWGCIRQGKFFIFWLLNGISTSYKSSMYHGAEPPLDVQVFYVAMFGIK